MVDQDVTDSVSLYHSSRCHGNCSVAVEPAQLSRSRTESKRACSQATCSALPCRIADVDVAVAADGSGFVDVGAEHPGNHLAVSLPPAAKARVLFSW